MGSWSLPGRLRAVVATLILAVLGVGLAVPVATASIPGNPEVYIGTTATVPVQFDNTGTATGYGPYVDLVIPAGSGLSYAGSDYLGQTLTVADNLVVPPGETTIDHPYHGEITGLTAGDRIIVLELPFGSVTSPQHPFDFTVDLVLSPDAPVNAPQDIEVYGGFRFGTNALDNPQVDPPIRQGTPGQGHVDPLLIDVHKNVDAPDHDTPIGPSFVHTFEITIDIAPGQTISNLVVTDHLPESLVYLANSLAVTGSTGVTVPGTTVSFNHIGADCEQTGGNVGPCEDTDLVVTLNGSIEVDANPAVPNEPVRPGQITIAFDFYLDIFDWNGVPTGGEEVDQGLNEVAIAGDWDGNTAHLGGGALSSFVPLTRLTGSDQLELSNTTGNHQDVHNGTIRLQKWVETEGSSNQSVAVNEEVTFILDFQVSDPSVFGNVIITDVLPNGLEYVTGSATLEIERNGVAVVASTLITPTVTTADTQGLSFNISQAIGGSGLLLGACVPDSGGAVDCETGFSSTEGRVEFRARVLRTYRGAGAGNVVQNDVLDNTASITGNVHSSGAGHPVVQGLTDTDGDNATVTIAPAGAQKRIHAIGNDTEPGTRPNVTAGDIVTFELDITLGSLSFRDLVITDYLPLPVFAVADPVTFLSSPPVDIPTAWTAWFGPGTDSRITGMPNTPATNPTPGIDPLTNSVSFSFADYTHPSVNSPARMVIRLAVPVVDTVLSDGLHVTNLLRVEDQNSSLQPAIEQQLVQMRYTRPVLNISNGVINVQNATSYSGSPAMPVAWPTPINSANRSNPEFNHNIVGLDSGDRVTYLVIVENEGRGRDGAFDVVVREQLPPGLLDVGDVDTDLSLSVRSGDEGAVLHTFAPGAWNDLFATGLTLTGNVLGRGLTEHDAEITDGSNILYFTYDVILPKSENHTRFETTSYVDAYAATAGGTSMTDPGLISDDVYVTIVGPDPEKSIVATSEPGTTDDAYVTIGEIVRYRVLVTIPEGTSTNLVIQDVLPRGMRYVASEGVQIATVAAAGGSMIVPGTTGTIVNHTTLAGVPAILSPGSHATASSVAVTAGTTSDTIAINLGNIENDASDTPRELLVLEFNALIANVAADNNGTVDNNDNRRRKDNTVTQTSGPTSARETQTSNTVTTRVIEPRLRVRKTVNPTGDVDAGNTVAYTITIDHNPALPTNSSIAHDVTVTDVLPQHFNYSSHTVSETGGVDGLAQPPINGDVITVTADELPPGDSITIVINGTLASSVPSNYEVVNTARAHGSSLPGGGTPSTDPDNLTGSTTPGAAATPPTGGGTGGTGVIDGERGYNTSGSASFTTRVIRPTKSIVSTSEAHTTGTDVAIGEIVRYRISVNIPEGVNNAVSITDTLPAGLLPVDLTGTGNQTRVSFYGSNLTLDTGLPAASNESCGAATGTLEASRISLTGNVITFNLDNVINNATDDSLACAVIEFNAIVTDVPGNSASTTLTNSATASANGSTSTPPSTTTVTVVEPDLQVTKRVVSVDAAFADVDTTTGNASNVDVGNQVTFEVVISNPVGTNTSTAFNIVFEDSLDAQYTFVTGSYTGPGITGQTIAAPAAPSTAIRFDVDADRGSEFGLAPGESITVTYTVSVDAYDPVSSAFGADIDNTAEITGTSVPPTPAAGNPTGSTREQGAERDDYGDDDDATVTLAEPELGLAKELTDGPDALDGGKYSLEFTFIVANTGDVPLTGIQVTDDLAAQFGVPTSMNIDSLAVTSIVTGAANPNYGVPGDWNLFVPAGIYLAVGASETITLQVEVTLPNPTTLPAEFTNQAVATGETPGGIPADPRYSADGGDPTDPPSTTEVDFDEDATIEVSKGVEGVSTNQDGSYNLSYTITATNTGEVTLSDLSLVDNLDGIYGATGTFTVSLVELVSGPTTVTVNWPGYNGVSVTELLGTGSSLAPDESAVVRINLVVNPQNSFANYTNTVTATGESPLGQDPVDSDTEVHSFEADPVLGVGTCLPQGGIVPVPGLLGAYDVTFTVHVQNYGNILLDNVQAELDLADIFTAADSWVLQSTTVDPDSIITVNPNFNGDTDIALFDGSTTLYTVGQAAADPDNRTDRATFEVTLRVVPGSTLLYQIQVEAEGESPIVPGGAQDGWIRSVLSDDDCLMDTVPDPTDPVVPTPLEFSNEPLIGVAKEFTRLEAVAGSPGTFDIDFTFVVGNYGNVPLTSVGLVEDFASVFQPADVWEITAITTDVTSSLVGSTATLPISPAGAFDLLDPASTLGTAAQAALSGDADEGTVTVTLRVMPDDAGHDYFNTVIAAGTDPVPGNPPVTDDSVDGPDPDVGGDPTDPTNPHDPSYDGDGDPSNNTSPTPFTFETPIIGVAKSAPATFDFGGTVGTVANPYNVGDGDYLVGYTLTIVNYGDVSLSDLVLTDDLLTQLAAATPVTVTALDGTLTADPAYDGSAGANILQAGQTLGYSQTELVTETVRVMVTLRPGAALAGGSLILENQAWVQGTSPGGQDVEDDSNSGVNPDNGQPNNDDPSFEDDGDPTNNDGPTVIELTESPLLAVGKSLVSLDNLGTGWYRVEFEFTLVNEGDVLLTNVQLEDDLVTAFRGSPIELVSLTVEPASPLTAVTLTSTTAVDPLVILDASASQLAVDESATVTLEFIFEPGDRIYEPGTSSVRPFENNADGAGASPGGRTVPDRSNDTTSGEPTTPGGPPVPGAPPTPGDDTPTPIVVTEDPVIGLAKSAEVTPLGDGRYDVLFTFTIRNYGTAEEDAVEVRNVQLTDSLTDAFGEGNYRVQSIYSPTLIVNTAAPDPTNPTAYDGHDNLNLLAGTDTLDVGESATVELRVTVTPPEARTYENLAHVEGRSPGDQPVTDTSTNGDDPDPNGDGIPDEDDPTPVPFTENPLIGLAKNATVTANDDGSFDITLLFTLRNMGDVPLSGVRVTDPLDGIYAISDLTPDRISVQSSVLTYNPAYDGRTDAEILAGTDVMPVGAERTVSVILRNVRPTSDTSATNSAVAHGTSPTGVPVSDRSTDGFEPDPNGDDVPDEEVPTPIELERITQVALAKSGVLTIDDDGTTLTLAFTFTVANAGNVDLYGIQVSDDLAEYYANTNLTASMISVASSDFTVNNAFDGRTDDHLLTGNDSLAVGEAGTVTLTLTGFTANAGVTELANSALADGRGPDGTPTDDPSNDGDTPVPGEDVPTITPRTENPVLGVAKDAGVTVALDGSFTVTFDFAIANYGNTRLVDISLHDDLSVFWNAGMTGVTVTSSDFPVNSSYDGRTDTELLGTGANLDVGDYGRLTLVLEGITTPGTYTNQAVGGGESPSGTPTPPEYSTDGPTPDPNGDGNPDEDDPTPVVLESTPLLGVAKRATVVQNADQSYNVDFTILLRNMGNTPLTSLQVHDDLSDFYTNTDMSAADVNVSSTDLTPNPAFDGQADTSVLAGTDVLAIGAEATVTITLSGITPAVPVTLTNLAIGEGTPPGENPVTDESTNGDDPDPNGDGIPGENEPTPVPLRPQPLIGIAKSAEVTANDDGSFELVFEFNVGNYGNTVLHNVQVRDDLSVFYGPTDISAGHITLSSPDFTVNAGYDGLTDLRLLTGADTLGIADSGSITMTISGLRISERVDTVNTAIATGTDPSGTVPTPPDRSTDGDDPDPDGDGDPGNNNTPTPVIIGDRPLIGLAKSAQTVNNGDGSYDITFTLTVRNYSTAPLFDLTLTDPLDQFYANTNLSADRVSTGSSTLTLNPAYDGDIDTELLAAGNSLAAGADASLTISLSSVVPNPGVTRLDNSALVTGTGPDGNDTSDTSTDGNDPDPDGSGPGNHNTPTPVYFDGALALLLQKSADPGPYMIGDRISYTLTITNPNDVATAISLTDVTPPATEYIADTASFDPEAVTPSEGSEPRQDEPGVLSWRAIVLPAGDTVTVTYELRVLPGAVSPLVNTASIAGTDVTAEATESVLLDQGVFELDRGLLIGRVYLDVNRNDTFDEGIDVPLAGARVVLVNGWQTLTDEQGNYAFRDLETGTWTVMVDQVTTPYTPSDHPEQLRDPRQHRVQVQGLTVSDFPFADLAGLASTRRETTVTFGPIELFKYQLPLGDTTRVVLELSSSDPWPPLLITDPVPGAADREFVVELSGDEPVFLSYDLPAGTQLTDPTIEWSNR